MGAAFGFAWIIFLFVHHPPYDSSLSVVSDVEAPPALREGLRFRDVSTALDLKFHHVELSHLAHPNKVDPVSSMSWTSPYPSVSIVDINDDGFMDIFIPGSPNLLYINDQGHGFHEAAKEYGLDSPELDSLNSFGLFADFNGDGKLDLFLARWPCHKLFYGAGPGKRFVDRSELLDGYCSYPEAVNVLDFNRDGRLDLVFGNLLGKKDELPPSIEYWFTASTYDNKTGAVTDLLTQRADGHFQWRKDIHFKGRPYSHALGISDVNEDGWPDIFVSNDYSTDQLYLNINGKAVKDVTQRYIPRQFHGLTGMNAEFADVDQTGHMDLFVSNAYKPPFARSYNLLWMKRPDASGFFNASIDRGVDKCGFAWGAKFADFNNDGKLDLAVTNGRDRSSRIERQSEGLSFWYWRSVISQIPRFLRVLYDNGTRHWRWRQKFYTSAFERDCLFMQDQDGHFYDVAGHTDLATDLQEGRGLALIDLDNDGKMDFIVANFRGDLRVWHNESTGTGDWIGFTLRDRNGNTIPHGSFVRLVRDGAPDLVVEYYPANGYRAQSDPRIHFGLGKENKLRYLEVRWPNGDLTRHVHLALNRYQTIDQGAKR